MSTNKELVNSLYEALLGGDVQTFVQAIDPGVEWVVSAGHPHGGTYVGLESVVKDVHSHAVNDWVDFHATPSFVTETDDEAVVIGTGYYSGTNKDTGKSMRSRFCHVWQVQDGKIVHFESISDTGALREATEK